MSTSTIDTVKTHIFISVFIQRKYWHNLLQKVRQFSESFEDPGFDPRSIVVFLSEVRGSHIRIAFPYCNGNPNIYIQFEEYLKEDLLYETYKSSLDLPIVAFFKPFDPGLILYNLFNKTCIAQPPYFLFQQIFSGLLLRFPENYRDISLCSDVLLKQVHFTLLEALVPNETERFDFEKKIIRSLSTEEFQFSKTLHIVSHSFALPTLQIDSYKKSNFKWFNLLLQATKELSNLIDDKLMVYMRILNIIHVQFALVTQTQLLQLFYPDYYKCTDDWPAETRKVQH